MEKVKGEMKRYLIIDGNLLLHKSQGVHGSLKTKVKGEVVHTGIPYGFLKAIVRLNKHYQFLRTCVVFDSGVAPMSVKQHARKPVVARDLLPRVDVFEDYKSSRGPLKIEIARGKKLLDRFLNCLPITVTYASPLYEADDVVAHVSNEVWLRRQDTNTDVIIYSDDKDFHQLIHGPKNGFRVFCHKRKDVIMDRKKLKEKFGLSPRQFVKYLALVGDSIDDIPGVKGVGPKTAVKLITEKRIKKTISKEDYEIYKRNISLIELSADQRVVLACRHGRLDMKKLNVLLNKFKMVSFQREQDQSVLRQLKPIKFLREC